MKTASLELQTFLATAQTIYVADLYYIKLVDGLELFWTDFDQSVTLSGQVYNLGPPLKRSRISQTIGLEVATLEIDLFAGPEHQIANVSGSGTLPILAAIVKDRFAGAEVIVQRVFMPTPGDTSLGSIVLFAGSVADVEAKRTSAQITVKSITEKLDQMIPRHLISPGCRHTLFGVGCELDEADWRTTGTVSSGSTRFVLNTSLTPPGGGTSPPSAPSLSQTSSSDANIPAQVVYVVLTYTTGNGETIASGETSLSMLVNRILHVASPASSTGVLGYNVYVGLASGDEVKQNQNPIAIGTAWVEDTGGLIIGTPPPPRISTAGYYALGVVTFTSGANAGTKRSILGNSGGTLNLKTGLPVAPATGDSFYVTPGDDKTKQTCQYKFNNLIRFGGFPYIPQPESAL